MENHDIAGFAGISHVLILKGFEVYRSQLVLTGRYQLHVQSTTSYYTCPRLAFGLDLTYVVLSAQVVASPSIYRRVFE